jgi:hypothetical protein
MKSLFLSLLLTSAAVLSTAADNPTFSGKWKIHSSIAGNENDLNCTFTQQENNFTGDCTGEQGTVKAAGKIDGSKVTWSYDSEYNGTALTVKYSGTLDAAGAKVSGTVSVDPFGVDGDFTGTQSK